MLVTPPPPLIKVASNSRRCSKLGGTTLNGREEGDQYCILQTCDQKEERSFFRRTISLFLQLVVVISRNGAGEGITKLNPCLWHFGAWVIYLAWENSQAMTGFPVEWRLSSDCRNSIPMTWTPPIWVRVVLLIGLAAREIYFKQSEALSHIWVMARHQYGISLLVPQASFRVALRNVGCVFRLRRLRSSEILVSRSVSGKTKQITWHGDEKCDFCSRSLLLLTPTTWFSLVRKRNRNAKSELESERDRR